MVDGMSERPPIPLVELVSHYREFKSKRDPSGRLVPGPYRSQAARVRLAKSYVDEPEQLVGRFFRSIEQFSSYRNVGESFIGTKRADSTEVATIEEIVNGPTAAAYLERRARKGKELISIEGLGDYSYVDRELVPARTTAGRRATMANRFDDEARTRSTSAMKADLLLRSLPTGRPTIGEVKVSTAKGDDADPVYALVQALALASQLVNANQRSRLRRHYAQENLAEAGALDVVVLLFLTAQSEGGRTHRANLVRLATELCAHLDEGLLLPHIDRVALVGVTPHHDQLRFAAWRP